MSYEEAKIKYSHQIGLMDFAFNVYLGVIYNKENHTPLRIYLLNNTNQPISVAVDPGFFCEDLHSEGEGINKTFEVSAKGVYEIDRYSDWGELDFTTYWYFYITEANKNLYKTSCSFSGRVFWREDEIKKRELKVFQFKDGKPTEKISETEAGFRLKWDFFEKIKSNGKLLVPPFFYYEEDKTSEERRIKGFLENPNSDLEYLKKYGFATETEVKEAIEKIPEAIEKKKIEMDYKLERLKKLEVIKEKLAEKMDKLKPKIGDIIYLETENEMGDLILGGKAKISDIEYHPSGQVFIKVEGFPELTYGWQFLEPKQEELKKKFGEQWFHRYEPNIIKNDTK